MIINGRSYYQYKLLRRPVGGTQEQFGFGSFLAFLSARVLRGGPRTLVQLVACLVALVLIVKLLPHRPHVSYSIWNWQNATAGDQAPVIEHDGSVPGGLRIVVFGDNDVATPSHLRDAEDVDVDRRSWTKILCEELNCSSYHSFVPTSNDPSHVMTSTQVYATSVERALNLTSENYGPGLDYNFLLDQFPIDWRVPDLSKQITQFLSMKKPTHSPAETLWVFSFGMWDIWSLATEPADVSKSIIDSTMSHLFGEVERLYASAMDNSSIAWSESKTFSSTNTSTASAGISMATPAPDTWIKERDPAEEEASKKEEDKAAGMEPPMDETKHFRILVPKLFDPSLTPGWKSARPNVPAVHSKAEQMRNAAMLTETWNDRLWSSMAEWIRTDERRREKAKALEKAKAQEMVPVEPNHVMPVRTALDIFNERLGGASVEAIQGKRAGDVVVGGQNHLPKARTVEEGVTERETQPGGLEAAAEEPKPDTIAGPPLPQRDGLLYELNKYLEEVIVNRQMRNSGLRDARRFGTLAEEGFLEVWTPCVGEPAPVTRTDSAHATATAPPRGDTASLDEREEDIPNTAVDGEDTPTRRKRDLAPAIRGRTPTTHVHPAEPDVVEFNTCLDPDDHLFFTPFTVSPRAVAVIARQAAEMVRRNDSVRLGWSSMNLPPLKFVGR